MSALGHSRPSHFVPVLNNVRYASDSDHSRYESELTLWAISRQYALQQNTMLFDHFVGTLQEWLRDGEAECLGSLEVDDELKLRRVLHRQVGRLGAPANQPSSDGLSGRIAAEWR
jgi:hypothetical protein